MILTKPLTLLMEALAPSLLLSKDHDKNIVELKTCSLWGQCVHITLDKNGMDEYQTIFKRDLELGFMEFKPKEMNMLHSPLPRL